MNIAGQRGGSIKGESRRSSCRRRVEVKYNSFNNSYKLQVKSFGKGDSLAICGRIQALELQFVVFAAAFFSKVMLLRSMAGGQACLLLLLHGASRFIAKESYISHFAATIVQPYGHTRRGDEH